jgi:two-component sensor histidine kinase
MSRKQVEEKIKASLKEKEVLLSEIHHRVKNNMQIISSLLKLQASSIGDERVTDVLRECRGRVQTMAFVHETLYSSDTLAFIDFKTYISKVANQIFQSYVTGKGRVKLEVDAEDIKLGIEQATPLGLITNELVTNSLKYAFPENRSGEIIVRIGAVEQDSIEFVFSDNGIGIPEGLDWRNTDSLGLRLVILLAENQLDGTVSLDRGKGTHFTVRFRHEENQ